MAYEPRSLPAISHSLRSSVKANLQLRDVARIAA